MTYESDSAIDGVTRDRIHGWLRDHNQSENSAFVRAMEAGAAKPLFILARGADGTVCGGLLGETVLGWLRVHLMAVQPVRQGKGIGTRLLAQAEEEARRRGCRKAYIDTMTYQGPEFYAKTAYAEVGRLRDWDSHGPDKVFLTKSL